MPVIMLEKPLRKHTRRFHPDASTDGKWKESKNGNGNGNGNGHTNGKANGKANLRTLGIGRSSTATRRLLVFKTYEEKKRLRRLFRDYLELNPQLSRRTPIRKLIQLSGLKTISLSSAYRVAAKYGFKGNRKNKSRYQRFWNLLNWKLPDSDLARIWRVERGNIQSKRLSLRLKKPIWRKIDDAKDPEYKKALKVERELRREKRRVRRPR